MSGGYRRTWDKEYYEKKARDRIENGEGDYARGSSESSIKNVAKEEFVPAGEGEIGPMGSQRAFLKARQSKIDLDSKVGKTEIITQTDAVQARGAGFWCEVCSCLLKDSSAYLDHINGKKRKF
jgi:U4/U6.U5 tri-snRNP component SNU23